MLTQDQSDVIAFLSSPSAHGGEPVERIETHSSVVFLAGTRAWKLKRAVRYDYLDFSTPERRRAMCEAELAINRRIAPAIYVGVSAVTRSRDGALALGGAGDAVDWVLEMVRFDGAGLFDRLAAGGRLDLGLMRALAQAIASFHRAAERRPGHGGREATDRVIHGNTAGFLEYGRGILDEAACADVERRSLSASARMAPLLDARRDRGLVRQCHGDLHLRNIVLLDGRPTLFDAIEFNDEFSCIDVFYDLAFLLMDLWRRGLPHHANAVLNGYLTDTRDVEGLAVLPLFLSLRAAVRAKTSATAAALESETRRRGEQHAASREYLRMALDLLAPPPASLIAIGGVSGTGKSTLARSIASSVGPVPGAVVLRSDAIRKELMGAHELTRLDSSAYTPAVSQKVYAEMMVRAGAVIGAGHAAIVDAVFTREADRRLVEALARSASVPFTGLWLDAPDDTLVRRVEARGPDASDADAAVIRLQRTEDHGSITWHRLDAVASPGLVRDRAMEHLKSSPVPVRPG